METISMTVYKRLLSYLRYLHTVSPGILHISSAAIGAALEVNDVQVRKDLAAVSSGGKPKVGYVTADLIADITHFLGYDNNTDAVIAGVGHLGKALMSYGNLKEYGINIIAAFDSNPSLIGTEHNKIHIINIQKAAGLCRRLNVRIGIIAVPGIHAQTVCDAFVEGGIKAIWNFAPVNLKAREGVTIRNEDIAASLAALIRTVK